MDKLMHFPGVGTGAGEAGTQTFLVLSMCVRKISESVFFKERTDRVIQFTKVYLNQQRCESF